MPNVAINGLGRIGRATFKILQDHPGLELVAVNDLGDAEQLAYLLQYDSVYRRYPRKVRVEGDDLVVGESRCRTFAEQDPERLPWAELGVDLVFECTGAFRDREALEKHFRAGAGRVILSAPAKGGDIPTVVHGVNHAEPPAPAISCASCTTNAVGPLMEVMARRVGVENAVLCTTHGYTATQRAQDGPAKKARRGRAAAVNLVPTSTGAAVATTKALPGLEGRFDGIAIRAPVVDGSIAVVAVVTSRPTTVEEVNVVFAEEAGTERYRGVLGVADAPLVSTDIIGDPRASVLDPEMTRVVGGTLVQLAAWYDNEWGYASQMVREARWMLAR